MSERYLAWLAHLAERDAQLTGLALICVTGVVMYYAFALWPAQLRPRAQQVSLAAAVVIYVACIVLVVGQMVGADRLAG